MKTATAMSCVLLGSVACGGRVDLGSPSSALRGADGKGSVDDGGVAQQSPEGSPGTTPPEGTSTNPTNAGMPSVTPPPGPGIPDTTPPSPGGWLAFDSDRDGTRGIYLIRSDGTGLVRLTTSSAVEMEPAFSSDGTKLAFTSNATGVFEIHVLNLATHVQGQLTKRGAHQPTWSRDGALVAFTGRVENPDAGYGMHLAPGIADLFVIQSDGTNWRSVVSVTDPSAWYPAYYPSSPVFASDPHTLVYVTNDSIRAIGTDGTGSREIAGVPSEGSETPAVSPNGTQVAFSSWDIQGNGIRVTSFTGDSFDPAHDGLSTIIVEPQSGTEVNRHPAWGPTGLIAYETGRVSGHASIATVPAAGGAHSLLTTDASDNRNPAWAPVGFQPSP